MSDHPLASLLIDAAQGRFPPVDGGWHRVPPWRHGVEAVLAFTGHAVLVLREDVPDALLDRLGPDGFGGAHHPHVLTALAGPRGWVDSLDAVLFARGAGGPGPLVARPDLAGHPRARHAREIRDGVRVLGRPTGSSLVTVSRGLGGLTEVSLEVAPEERGTGLGTALFRDLLAAVDAGTPVVASVAPGNVASLRAALRAGFVPIGSVQLYRRGVGPGPPVGRRPPWRGTGRARGLGDRAVGGVLDDLGEGLPSPRPTEAGRTPRVSLSRGWQPRAPVRHPDERGD